jgi:hypothetical protein|nr:MAG TPA: hypothetical protein [Herelleviridae sp.]
MDVLSLAVEYFCSQAVLRWFISLQETNGISTVPHTEGDRILLEKVAHPIGSMQGESEHG